MKRRLTQFCPKGHDVFIVGRASNRRCNTCETENKTRWKKNHPDALRKHSKTWYYRNKERVIARIKTLNRLYPDRQINRELKRNYGISIDQKREMLAAQQYKCLICTEALMTIALAHVDHDHKTSRVRGLLCRACNLLLGLAKDNLQILANAARYLTSRSERQETLSATSAIKEP